MTIALHQLRALGQTVWLDSISHDLIQSGALNELITRGIRGGTIDPQSYTPTLTRRHGGDWLTGASAARDATRSPAEAILREDSRRAAEMLRASYEQSRGQEGFASVPVPASLAHDTSGLVAAARRLYLAIARPNVMIAVPATAAGIAALRLLIAEGINVQATLLFSLDGYKQVVDAYLDGLEHRAAAGEPLASVAAVAGFGIAPVDHEVDRQLRHRQYATQGEPARLALAALRGQAAVANARVAYQHFQQRFGSARFAALRAQGAQVQRLLWTGTEVPPSECGDTRYVEALLGPETIAALALPTLEAFEEHGRLCRRVDQHREEAYATLHAVAAQGINLAEVAEYLLAQGLRAAADPFRRAAGSPLQPVVPAGARPAPSPR